jgi:hypothetical protein
VYVLYGWKGGPSFERKKTNVPWKGEIVVMLKHNLVHTLQIISTDPNSNDDMCVLVMIELWLLLSRYLRMVMMKMIIMMMVILVMMTSDDFRRWWR